MPIPISRASRNGDNQKAGTLSGGEQQMLAIGRALMARPSVLLLDEPSMGLSPILTEQIFQIIRDINGQGTTVLLVEQNAQMALNVAHRGYVLQTGPDHPVRHGRQPGRQPAGPPGLPRRDLARPGPASPPGAQAPMTRQPYRPDLRPMLLLVVVLVVVIVGWILLSPLVLPH